MSKDELDPRMEMGGDVVALERRAVLRDEIGSVLSPWGEYDVADALAVLMDARCGRDVPEMSPDQQRLGEEYIIGDLCIVLTTTHSGPLLNYTGVRPHQMYRIINIS